MPAKLAHTALLGLVLVLVPSVAPAERAPNIRSHPYFVTAGDLDRDGIVDGLSLEHTRPIAELEAAAIGGYDRVIRGRSGADGTVLWTLTGLEGSLLPARVGTEAGDGIIEFKGATVDWLCECTTATWGDPDLNATFLAPVNGLSLVARDGAANVLWERAYDPPSGGGATITSPNGETRAQAYEELPMLGGLFQGAAGPATDALVVLSSRRDVGEEVEASVDLQVLDGTDGGVTASWTVGGEGRQPTARTIGDLDGDGLDDVVVANAPSTGSLSAYASSDGSLLWRNDTLGVGRYFLVRDLGDLDGDGADELSIRAYGNIFYGDADPRAHLLDGGDGTTLLTIPSGTILPLGDVDGDGSLELVHATSTRSGTTASVTYRHVALDGSVVRSATFSESVTSSENLYFDERIGDVTGDGFPDLGHHVARPGEREWQGVAVDGRSLQRALAEPSLQPLRASLDGSGDDFLGVRVDGRQLVVTAQDGGTGAVSWERRFGFDETVDSLNIGWHFEAADVSGDGIADVIVNARFPREGEKKPGANDQVRPSYADVRTWALSGSTGTTIWSL